MGGGYRKIHDGITTYYKESPGTILGFPGFLPCIATTDYVGGAKKALAMKREIKTPFGVK